MSNEEKLKLEDNIENKLNNNLALDIEEAKYVFDCDETRYFCDEVLIFAGRVLVKYIEELEQQNEEISTTKRKLIYKMRGQML